MEINENLGDNLLNALHLSVCYEDIFAELNNKNYVHSRDERGATTLHLACKYTRDAVIYKLLNIGVHINEPDNFGKTSLHYAVAANSIEIVLILISYGADINAPDNFGQTPLFYACQYRREKLILLLLHYAADIEHRNSKGETVLLQMCAAKKGNFIEIIKLLIIMNANIFATNKYGQTVFQCAVQNDLDEIILLLSSIKNNPKDNERLFDGIIKTLNLNFYATNEWNETFLHIICSNYRRKDKKNLPWQSLMDRSQSVFGRIILNLFQFSAVGLPQNECFENNAPVHRTYQIIKLLVNTLNINVNAKNYLGETVLHLLCTKTIAAEEFSKCLQFLIENGADINITDNCKVPPLQYAILKSNIEYVDIMLTNGANAEFNCKPNTKCILKSNRSVFLQHLIFIAVNSFNERLFLLCIAIVIWDNFEDIITIPLTIYPRFIIRILVSMFLKHHSIFMPGLISTALQNKILKQFNLNLNGTYTAIELPRSFFSICNDFLHLKLKSTPPIALFIIAMNGDANIQGHLNNICSIPEYGDSDVFKELRKLNDLKFNNTAITVLQFLLADQNKSKTFVCNENIFKQLTSANFFENNAPLFCKYLKAKLRETLERKTLLKDAAEQIRTLIPEHVKLDEIPLKLICSMLNNDHLKILID